MPIISGGGGGGSGTVTSVTATDTSIVVAGTAAAPTIATGTLDVIAAQHAPAANWSNNSKKITGLADGAGAQDAAAFGQIPTALPPNGAAGGDLTGTYPNPTIGAGKVLASYLQTRPLQLAYPAGQTIKAITFDPVEAINALTITSGTVYLFQIYLAGGVAITSISFCSSTVSLAAGTHQLFGIYNSSLSRVAVSADDTSTAWGGSTVKTLNLTPGTYTPPTDGLYYLGLLVTAATPPNIFSSASFFTVLSTFRNTASYDTAQTSLPATATYGANLDKTAIGWVN